jgi:hypothetical protein
METHRRVRRGGLAAGGGVLRLLVVGVMATAALGCQSGWRYDWGSYQRSVWLMYAAPSDNAADVGKQIDSLEAEIRKTEAKARANEASRVPPGKYAHLGYLYAMQGDQVNCRRCLDSEKRLYPESAHFIDGLMARMR